MTNGSDADGLQHRDAIARITYVVQTMQTLCCTTKDSCSARWHSQRNHTNIMTMKKPDNNTDIRTMRMDCRLTPAEYEAVKRKCSACGMTLSNYLRRCAIGHAPRQHLTEKECDILCALTDRRSELYHIRNILNGLSQDERQRLFHDMRFMRQWLRGVDDMMAQFDYIIEQLKS